MCKKLSNYFDNTFSKFQCGFSKGYSPQHSLLLMIVLWKKTVYSNKVFGAVLADLSKAFYCIRHDLLIAKLNAYRLSQPALILIKDYLQNRKQRTKIGSFYTVIGKILLRKFRKDHCQDPFCSISFYVNFFLKMKAITFQIMLMIPPHTLLVA